MQAQDSFIYWKNDLSQSIEFPYEMFPRRCPSTLLQAAYLSFHLWQVHLIPKAFLQATAREIYRYDKMLIYFGNFESKH